MWRPLAAAVAAAAFALAHDTLTAEPLPDGPWAWSQAHGTWAWQHGGALWLWVAGAPWRHFRDEDEDSPRHSGWGESESDSDADGGHSSRGGAFPVGGRQGCHPLARRRCTWTRWTGGPDPVLETERYQRQDARRRAVRLAEWHAAACSAAASPPLPLEAEAAVRAFLGAHPRACWESQAAREAESNRRARWARAAARAAAQQPGPAKLVLRAHLGLLG